MNEGLVTLIGFVLNVGLAYLVKKNMGGTISKLIPVLNIAVGVLTQVVNAATQATATTVPAAYAVAGFFGTFGKGFADAFINGLLQGLLTTGLHSSAKNLGQAAKK